MVTLAGMLRRALGDGRLGTIIGLGTGLAYRFCNLPAIFDASATTHAQLALLAVVAGLIGGGALWPRVVVDSPRGGDYARGGTAAWVLVFFALVCLDSAAFYFIQHTPALKESLWSGAGQQVLNAGAQVGAAGLAGWTMDRCWMGRTVWLGAGAVVGACLLIIGRHPVFAGTGLLYIAGVSIYSTPWCFNRRAVGAPGWPRWFTPWPGGVNRGWASAWRKDGRSCPRR